MANTTDPGLISEIFGQAAYHFNLIQPYLKTELHTILAALFPIVIGAHASLTRPPSAAKPQKRRESKSHVGDAGSEDEDEEEEDSFQRMEGFSRSDALFLPLYAGATLTGLYFLIKYLKDLNVLNMVLNYYFSSVGVFSVCKLLADALQLSARFVFPTYYAGSSGDGIWQVNPAKKETVDISQQVPGVPSSAAPRTSPLPGLLAHLPLPAAAVELLWQARQLVEDKLTFKFYVHRIAAARIHLSPLGIIGTFLGLAATLYYNFVEKTWWLTNLMGFAFSYTALQLISPTTFDTGSLILAALFVYDVVMVFYTPMMVTVAKNLDVPIKLLIPRKSDKDGVAQFSMLGLGDVVLPGMMIALALRFDLYLHYLRLQKTVKTNEHPTGKETTEVVKAPYVAPSKHWANQFWTQSWTGGQSNALPAIGALGSFKKTYFWTSVVGYIVGMITTLFVMITFQHPQPALLYLVPGVLISLWGMAFIKSDVKVMYEYTEAEEEPAGDASKDKKDITEKSKPASNGSFFSSGKVERNSKKLDKAMSKLVEHGHTSDEEDEGKQEKSQKKVEAVERKLRKDTSKDLFYFGVSWYQPKGRKREQVKWASTEGGGGEVDEHVRKRLRTA
jgi:minor histocompatibility antigen H13